MTKPSGVVSITVVKIVSRWYQGQPRIQSRMTAGSRMPMREGDGRPDEGPPPARPDQDVLRFRPGARVVPAWGAVRGSGDAHEVPPLSSFTRLSMSDLESFVPKSWGMIPCGNPGVMYLFGSTIDSRM